VRVEAEVVRDIALRASGLMGMQVGGPSVFPPQPEGATGLSSGVWAWKTSTGPDRYRRGMYTFRKRTSPYAAFALFDAPSGETCTVRRVRSNTPLQALTLLNDSVFVETSRALARRALDEAPATAEGRARYIFRLCLTRPPDAGELRALTDFYRRQRERFRSGVLAARVAGPLPAKQDVEELAAWTTVARVLLNLDETITKE
jgi:hypothetical protein